jgi:cobalamin-dependent methionine synthase I
LNRIAERLPNGLLQRLVDDAQFFHDWNLRKHRARASARLAQFQAWKGKAEDRYWKTLNR